MIPFDALKPYDQHALAYTMEDELDRISMDSVFARFSPLEQTILREIYELDTSMSDLAAKLGYSRRHVARLHRQTLRKLAMMVRPAESCSGHF